VRLQLAGAAVFAAAVARVFVDGSSDSKESCPAAGYSSGSTDYDGVFFAVVDRRCVGGAGASCEVRDGRGSIARRTVDRGIDQDCVVSNQFVGTGVASGSGRYLGECGGRARAGASTPVDVSRGRRATVRAARPATSPSASRDRRTSASPGAPALPSADPWRRAKAAAPACGRLPGSVFVVN